MIMTQGFINFSLLSDDIAFIFSLNFDLLTNLIGNRIAAFKKAGIAVAETPSVIAQTLIDIL